MREYTTVAKVDAVLGVGWHGDSDPDLAVLKANLWVDSKVTGVSEPTPHNVELAAAHIARDAAKGLVLGSVDRETLEETVSAQSGTFVTEKFSKGSRSISEGENLALALLAPWMAAKNKLVGFAFLSRT